MTIRKNKVQIFATFLIIALLWATIFCGSAYAVNVITIDKVIYGCSDIEQTWAQWCETTENTIGIYVDSRGYVKSADGYNIMADGGTAPDDFQLGTDKPADATHFVVYKDKTVIVPMYASLTAKSIDFDISEKITISSTGGSTDLTISDLEISNPRMSQPLIVENIEVSAAGAWKLVSAETDFTSIAANSNVFSMECSEHDFSDGKMLDGSIIENGSSKAYSFTGGTGKVTKDYSGNIGQAIVTVNAGNYVFSKKGMMPTYSEQKLGDTYLKSFISANSTYSTIALEYSEEEPVYENGTWIFPNSTIEIISNTDTYIPSPSSDFFYVRAVNNSDAHRPSTWYGATGFYCGPLDSSGKCGKGVNYTHQYSASVGSDILGYTASNNQAMYPDGGWQDGYYYELVYPQQVVTFYIDSTEFTADPDMTWEAWCASDYNTIGAYVMATEGSLVRYALDGMLYAVKSDSYTPVVKEDLIIDGHAYLVSEEGPA